MSHRNHQLVETLLTGGVVGGCARWLGILFISSSVSARLPLYSHLFWSLRSR